MQKLFMLFGTFLLFSGFKPVEESAVGKKISDFCLKDVSGKNVSLSDYSNAKGFIVVFTCNHCPFAKLYTTRLNDLNKRYKALGVPLIAVNSMDNTVYAIESAEAMLERAKSDQYNFPYLRDTEQEVAKDFKAAHTPQAFVIWRVNNQWQIKYCGVIDNNGKEPDRATPYVANAVEELLKGKLVSNSETTSFGCAIHFRK